MKRQKTYTTLILTVLLMLLPAVNMSATDFITAPTDTIDYGNYSYIRFLSESESVTISDEEFNDIAGKVVFPVNKYTLPGNSIFLHELETEVIPMLRSNNLEIVCVMMRGTASPEGPYRFNKYLGEQRSKSLMEFLKERLGNDIALKVDLEVEDYGRLCQMMKQAGDPDYEEVRRLCDKYLLHADKPHTLKRALMKLKGGRVWKRLKREYFPQLRTASVVFFLRKQKKDEPPVDISKQHQGTITPQNNPDNEFIGRDTVLTDNSGCIPEVEEEQLVRVPRRELLAIKTNLLLDAAYVPGYDAWCPIPNVALEYFPKSGHFTFGASIDFPWWKNYWKHKYFEIRNYQVEARYYLKGSQPYDRQTSLVGYEAPAFSGFYLQAYANAGIFCLCFDADRGWIGEGFGGGVGCGYVMPISKNGHWRLEFSAQVGFFTCKYDPFQFEYRGFELNDHLYYYDWVQPANQFKKRQYRFNWIGPTRIGITLSYDILYRRKAKKGISFRNYEYETYRVNKAYGAYDQERRAAE